MLTDLKNERREPGAAIPGLQRVRNASARATMRRDRRVLPHCPARAPVAVDQDLGKYKSWGCFSSCRRHRAPQVFERVSKSPPASTRATANLERRAASTASRRGCHQACSIAWAANGGVLARKRAAAASAVLDMSPSTRARLIGDLAVSASSTDLEPTAAWAERARKRTADEEARQLGGG